MSIPTQGRAMRQTFTAYGEELRRVDRFKHLGRVLSYDDSDTPAIRYNLKWARPRRLPQ